MLVTLTGGAGAGKTTLAAALAATAPGTSKPPATTGT
jgi:predicted ATPase